MRHTVAHLAAIDEAVSVGRLVAGVPGAAGWQEDGTEGEGRVTGKPAESSPVIAAGEPARASGADVGPRQRRVRRWSSDIQPELPLGEEPPVPVGDVPRTGSDLSDVLATQKLTNALLERLLALFGTGRDGRGPAIGEIAAREVTRLVS